VLHRVSFLVFQRLKHWKIIFFLASYIYLFMQTDYRLYYFLMLLEGPFLHFS